MKQLYPFFLVIIIFFNACDKKNNPFSSNEPEYHTSVRVTILSFTLDQDRYYISFDIKNTGNTTIVMTELEFLVEFTDGSKKIVKHTTFWQKPGDSIQESFYFNYDGRYIRRVTHYSSNISTW